MAGRILAVAGASGLGSCAGVLAAPLLPGPGQAEADALDDVQSVAADGVADEQLVLLAARWLGR
jgi:hypothetical protein